MLTRSNFSQKRTKINTRGLTRIYHYFSYDLYHRYFGYQLPMLLLWLYLLPSLPVWLICLRGRARSAAFCRILYCVTRLLMFSQFLQAVECIYLSTPLSSIGITLSTNYPPSRDFKIKTSEVRMVKFHTGNPKHDPWLATRYKIVSITDQKQYFILSNTLIHFPLSGGFA